jgi:hypothetical protein
MTTFKTEDKQEAEKPHIFVATPMYGGMCAGYYTQSIISLVNVFRQVDFDSSFSFMFNESLITRARNALANNFLKSPATHLMFIDADIKFNPAEIPLMVHADKEIICGIYPKKEINWKTVRSAIDAGVEDDKLPTHTGSFVVNLVGYEGEVTVPINQPCEIWNGGTGFMLIKREVFEKLADKVPTYNNDVRDLSGNVRPESEIKEYFATSIEPGTNRLLSEDYHFCKIARDNGIKVWAAPWVQLGHLGTYLFDGKLLQTP